MVEPDALVKKRLSIALQGRALWKRLFSGGDDGKSSERFPWLWLGLILVVMALYARGRLWDIEHLKSIGPVGDFYGGMLTAASLMFIAFGFRLQTKELKGQREQIEVQNTEMRENVRAQQEISSAQRSGLELEIRSRLLENTQKPSADYIQVKDSRVRSNDSVYLESIARRHILAVVAALDWAEDNYVEGRKKEKERFLMMVDASIDYQLRSEFDRWLKRERDHPDLEFYERCYERSNSLEDKQLS